MDRVAQLGILTSTSLVQSTGPSSTQIASQTSLNSILIPAMPRESAQLAARLATYKRIILCADGTWLASDLGDASVPSNVARIARTIATSGPDPHGNIVQQIVSYHSGLGSGELPFQKAIYGKIRIFQFETVQC